MDGTWNEPEAPSSSGDVVGPDEAVDNDIALFDGTTGKLIKDGGYSPSSFAVAAKGVTNGDSHDHVGGDGAAITEGALSLSDVTTKNASTSAHGFLKKLPNNSGQYMDGAGNWTNPADWTYNSYTSDQTLADSLTHRIISVTPTPAVTITLPSCANNTGMMILIRKKNQIEGYVAITCTGTETIDGFTTINLHSAYDYIMVISDGTTWMEIKQRRTLDSGWIARSDWTNVHLGSISVFHDNVTGTYLAGEKVIEYSNSARTIATGKYGYIYFIYGGLHLRNVGGGGNFTDNYYLKGERSGATSQVNGATKNVDKVFTHLWVGYADSILFSLSVSETGSDTDAYFWNAGYNYGSYALQVTCPDYNNMKIHTGSSGFYYSDDSGAAVLLDTEDWYYRVQLRVID